MCIIIIFVQILKKDPQARLPLAQIMQHPWIVANACESKERTNSAPTLER